ILLASSKLGARVGLVTMAEAALYGFTDDPTFPFYSVACRVEWIPAYIERLTRDRVWDLSQRRTFEILIKVLLFFCLVRTSGLIKFEGVYKDVPHFAAVKWLVSKLNRILNRVPRGEGKPHRLAIYRFDRQRWFIATKNSARFSWKSNPTHRDVGLNLDF